MPYRNRYEPEPRTEPPEPRFVRDTYGNEIYEGETYYMTVTGELFCDKNSLIEAIVEEIQEMTISELKEKFDIEERILTWEK